MPPRGFAPGMTSASAVTSAGSFLISFSRSARMRTGSSIIVSVMVGRALLERIFSRLISELVPSNSTLMLCFFSISGNSPSVSPGIAGPPMKISRVCARTILGKPVTSAAPAAAPLASTRRREMRELFDMEDPLSWTVGVSLFSAASPLAIDDGRMHAHSCCARSAGALRLSIWRLRKPAFAARPLSRRACGRPD